MWPNWDLKPGPTIVQGCTVTIRRQRRTIQESQFSKKDKTQQVTSAGWRQKGHPAVENLLHYVLPLAHLEKWPLKWCECTLRSAHLTFSTSYSPPLRMPINLSGWGSNFGWKPLPDVSTVSKNVILSHFCAHHQATVRYTLICENRQLTLDNNMWVLYHSNYDDCIWVLKTMKPTLTKYLNDQVSECMHE